MWTLTGERMFRSCASASVTCCLGRSLWCGTGPDFPNALTRM